MIQLSHVLYRVEDLHFAVKKLQEAGFIVEYGTEVSKAYNAIIWFERGVFIELYNNSGLSGFVQWFMKTFGYKPVLERLDKWNNIRNSWCEWSLETTEDNLKKEKQWFQKDGIPFKSHKGTRRTIDGQRLSWDLIFPNDIWLPFIMSAYIPNPRPSNIQHPNGIKGVKSLTLGTEKLNLHLLKKLLPDQAGLKLVEGRIGLQTVELLDSELKIEDILR